MRSKTDAAKALLDAGWTFEEVQRVLGEAAQVAPYPLPVPLPPYAPERWPVADRFWWTYGPYYDPHITTTDTITLNS